MANSGLRPTPETAGHLAALVGANKVDVINHKFHDALQDQRSILLGKVSKDTGNADFFVMLSKGASGTVVEDVKFVSGSENLKGLADVLRNAKYGFGFPDETATKVFRRGTVSCANAKGDCTFVMALAEDVRSVN